MSRKHYSNWPHIAPVLTGTKQCCINPQSQRNLSENRRAAAKAKAKAKGKAKSKAKTKAKAAPKADGGPKKTRQDTPYNVERKKFFKKLLSCNMVQYMSLHDSMIFPKP